MMSDANRDLVIVRSLGCQWIGGNQDPRYTQVHYCGSRDLYKDTVYCTDHQHHMYQKGSALRKRKKEQRQADHRLDLESLFNEAVLELTAEGHL